MLGVSRFLYLAPRPWIHDQRYRAWLVFGNRGDQYIFVGRCGKQDEEVALTRSIRNQKVILSVVYIDKCPDVGTNVRDLEDTAFYK